MDAWLHGGIDAIVIVRFNPFEKFDPLIGRTIDFIQYLL